jgi:oligoendopeptidase F
MPTATLFDKLPAVAPRRFVPGAFDPADWAQLESQLDRLDAVAVRSSADLESWLLDQTELADVVDQAYCKTFIRMTVDTADAVAEREYLHFVEEIIPKAQPRWNTLNRALLESPFLDQLSARYALLIKRRRNALELFREENVPLEAEEASSISSTTRSKGPRPPSLTARSAP